MVQKPEDADFNGMPLSAIGTNSVNYVLPAHQLGEKLSEITTSHESGFSLENEIFKDQEGFDKILLLVKLFANLDFSGYKKNTLVRRVAKRIKLLELNSLKQYLNYFEKSNDEAKWLSEDFLIGVTGFFRDPDVWKIMEEEVLTDLINKAKENHTLKFSCIGCSSGEEAYTLALITKELIEKSGKDLEFKIFAVTFLESV